MIDAGLVVFDLDGTLVDSSVDLANAVNALLLELGAGPLAEPSIIAMVGEGATVLVRRALTAASLDPETPRALERFLAHYDPHLLDHTVPYPGMVETLDWIGGRLPMAVLTNKPARATQLMLEGLGLRRHFRDVIGGDTALGRKPDPAGLLHLAAAVEIAPARIVMVGDSPVDLATARHAGTQICLARYGFGYRFTPEDYRGDELFIDSPSDLAELLHRRERRTRNKP
jgi:phosphoglycolate phosphatase